MKVVVLMALHAIHLLRVMCLFNANLTSFKRFFLFTAPFWVIFWCSIEFLRTHHHHHIPPTHIIGKLILFSLIDFHSTLALIF